MGSRHNEPRSEDPWSVLGSKVVQARETTQASERIKQVLARHPKKDAPAVMPETTPDTTPVISAPTPPPSENQSKEDWITRCREATGCDWETAESIYAGAKRNYKGKED